MCENNSASTCGGRWLDGIVRIGHCDGAQGDPDAQTGVTAFVFMRPLCTAALVCGSAPATREIPAVNLGSSVTHIHGILMTGGSAMGLDSAGGLLRWQRELGIGVPTRYGVVPVCPAAAVFDLSRSPNKFPTPDDGYAACRNAGNVAELRTGKVGAGRGCTCGKYGAPGTFTPSCGGFGMATRASSEIYVAAFVVANPFGAVVGEDSSYIAGAKGALGWIDVTEGVCAAKEGQISFRTNTTLVALFTNVIFDRGDLCKICKMATAGIGRAVRPAFSPYDGDVVFAVSTGDVSRGEDPAARAASVTAVGELAASAITEAIRGAVDPNV